MQNYIETFQTGATAISLLATFTKSNLGPGLLLGLFILNELLRRKLRSIFRNYFLLAVSCKGLFLNKYNFESAGLQQPL